MVKCVLDFAADTLEYETVELLYVVLSAGFFFLGAGGTHTT